MEKSAEMAEKSNFITEFCKGNVGYKIIETRILFILLSNDWLIASTCLFLHYCLKYKMALLETRHIGNDCMLGIWKLAETEEELRAVLPGIFYNEELQKIVHAQKRLEWLSSRCLCHVLLAEMQLPPAAILKDECGKPFLSGGAGQLSFSHSGEYAVAILHLHCRVGIDLEPAREKIARVAPRVFSEEELKHADSLEKQTLYWCAKEALYKLYGKRELNFKNEIRISYSEGRYSGSVHRYGEDHHAELTVGRIGEYTMVYAIEKY